ncbi:MAG TPA: PAS domain-containing sensor histidine kinase [Acidimicrobiales bacterium]|nr:PAS domain-containing sensor histidine kinase [Acidimicrobiales bacterium]
MSGTPWTRSLRRTFERAGVGPAPRPGADTVAVRAVARLRAALALGVAAAGSFIPNLSHRVATLFVVLGLLWVPWACAVLFAADRANDRFARFGGPVGDVLAIFSLQAFLPGSETGALLGYLVVVGFTLYTVGRPAAALLSALTLALTLVAQELVARGDRLQVSEVVPFSAALVALVFLFDRTVVVQRRAAAHTEILQGQADAILARVADGVVVTDAMGCVKLWNSAAQRLTGHPEDEGADMRCEEMLGLHAGERPLRCRGTCGLLELGEGAGAELGWEVWRFDRSGRRQPLLANAECVTDADGVVVEVVHSLRDVTRLKQAEEAKTLFLATASHELKTPLTVIKGFAETLLTYPETAADTREVALAAILRRSEELTKIVDRLLLSSRIESGRIQIDVEAVYLGSILEERTAALAGATGRDIDCSIAPDLPPVLGDEASLTTIVDHLLDNALKYSPDLGPVSVVARVVDSDLGVRLDITDHGIGMMAEEAAACFDKFWQAESSDLRRFGGTGVGLYIVRSLVDAMEGRIDVSSELGQGTTFSVWLPRAQVGGPPEAEAEPVTAGVGESSSIREFMRQIGVPAARKEA